jgi:hypothetical protein
VGLSGRWSDTDIDVSTTEPGNPRVRELEQRIEELEASDEATFGHFTSVDWTLCIVFAVLFPLLGIWWFAP